MSTLTRINQKARQAEETGLGAKSANSGGRYFNKDGSPNVILRGVPFLQRLSLYKYMLKLSTARFILLIAFCYLVMNFLFATLYYIIGINHLGGINADDTMNDFWQAFFFSAQTLTTVGYGHIHPSGFVTSMIATIESLLGLLMFAVATGLMYGRFAQPKAYIVYSKNALFAPFRGGTALMFRLAPYKAHFLSDVEVKLTLSLKLMENGEQVNRFFTVKPQIEKANTLSLNWTIVHLIDEESPLYGLSEEDIRAAEAELLVFVKGFDETYSNTVVSRSSYTWKEFVYGARFTLMYHPSESKTHTVMDLGKLNQFEFADLPIRSDNGNRYRH